jgi:hypothetical protein
VNRACPLNLYREYGVRLRLRRDGVPDGEKERQLRLKSLFVHGISRTG